VREDIRSHRENGASLNPFSTQRARSSWQNGFDGKPLGMMDWADEHERGKVCAELFGKDKKA